MILNVHYKVFVRHVKREHQKLAVAILLSREKIELCFSRALFSMNATPLGKLNTLGILEFWQLPLLLPKHYIDLRDSAIVEQFRVWLEGRFCVVRGVLTEYRVVRDSVPNRMIVTLVDTSGLTVQATFFGRTKDLLPILADKQRSTVAMTGTMSFFSGRPQLKNPEWVDETQLGRVIPVYPGKPRVIHSARVFETMQTLLPEAIPACAQKLLEDLNWSVAEESEKIGLVLNGNGDSRLSALLTAIHQPETVELGGKAIQLLKLVATGHVLSRAKREAQRPVNGHAAIPIAPALPAKLFSEAALTPTPEQQAVVEDICRDLRSNTPMNRLLSADVGFGKTYVAAAAAAAVFRSGGTVAWLCPNQPLAVQTQQAIAGWWPDLEPVLILGNQAQTASVARFMVGTTALMHRLPPNKQINFLVCDESQKFGLAQIRSLIGEHTHFLNCTATCIPRTAALVAFAGMAVSCLTRPHVDKTVKTRLLTKAHRIPLFESLKRTIQNGHQALVVYPLAESSAQLAKDRKSAEGAFALWDAVFPGRVRYIHGRLSDQDKLNAVQAMRDNDADLLISTTAIETGIDLPRLRHVVIVHPERLGLNTLHQIRGRVARAGGFGRCDLYLPKDLEPDSLKRLEILVRYTDGFDVARENMRLQGIGDIGSSGLAQSGQTESFIPGHKINFKEIHWVLNRWST